jgi:hypothetical protein
MNDHIGSAHMTQGDLTAFTLDRFGNNNSALALNGGWTQVPAGIYFDTPEFTISAWVYPQQIGSWARLIDFTNGRQDGDFILTLDSLNTKCPYGQIGQFALEISASSLCLTLNHWQLLTATFDDNTFIIYINGTLTASGTKFITYSQLPSLYRDQNYIGKSNAGPLDGYSHSYIDDLRFYNKSLTQQEIFDLIMMNDVSSDICSTTTAASTGKSVIKFLIRGFKCLTKLKLNKNKPKQQQQHQFLNVIILAVMPMQLIAQKEI